MIDYLKKKILNLGIKQKFFMKFNGQEKILELGCGSGGNANLIKKQFPQTDYHGIDLLPENSIPAIINYKVIDLENGSLPYSTEYFDIIIFTHVIEHLKTPLSLGKEINRVLKKGGSIYLETPNWTTMFVPSFGIHREQHNPFNFFDDPSHVKPWSKHGIYEFLLQSCSLEVRKIGTVRNWPRLPLDFIMILVGILSGKRSMIVSSFWNIYGWCIYGIGIKY